MDLQGFELLESKIESMLDRHADLIRERDRLNDQLAEAEAKMKGMAGQIERYEKERAEVKARVERIMGRLESVVLS